ncbi:hypothetical protein ACHAXS_008690 [Conticribra weissflogii]
MRGRAGESHGLAELAGLLERRAETLSGRGEGGVGGVDVRGVGVGEYGAAEVGFGGIRGLGKWGWRWVNGDASLGDGVGGRGTKLRTGWSKGSRLDGWQCGRRRTGSLGREN